MADQDGKIIALRRGSSREPVHPLVVQWRRKAEDIYAAPEWRSAMAKCAQELASYEALT